MKKKQTKETLWELILEILLALVFFAIGYGIMTILGFGDGIDSVDPDTAILIGVIVFFAVFGVIFGLVSFALKKLAKKKAAESHKPEARRFIFTVDDNAIFLEALAKETPESIFDNPYLAMYKRLHEQFGLKVQLNLFYERASFNLSEMPDRYRPEWRANAHWLKLSFHSRLENVKPYIDSDYCEVYRDATAVNGEILRFAGEGSLAKTTTLHYCRATEEGLRALSDLGITGLLGLYGREDSPRTSYQSSEADSKIIREGATVNCGGISYAGIDIILNKFETEEILRALDSLDGRALIKVMIHEQYFYPDYKAYQSDFEEKLGATFAKLADMGYESAFFEEVL